MKKAAILAIFGAVAAGAAAVCAKLIRDRKNEEEIEYTECPCGCDEENQFAQEEAAQQEKPQEDQPAKPEAPSEQESTIAQEEAVSGEAVCEQPVENTPDEPQEVDDEETI